MSNQTITSNQDNAQNLALLADHQLRAIELQHKRLTADGERHCDIDIQFYLVVLVRLERCAYRALDRLDQGGKIRTAIDGFEGRVRGYDDIRDYTEHMDAYAVGKGQNQKKGGMQHIPGIYWSGVGQDVRIHYAGYEIVISQATEAARELHRVLHEVLDPQFST